MGRTFKYKIRRFDNENLSVQDLRDMFDIDKKYSGIAGHFSLLPWGWYNPTWKVQNDPRIKDSHIYLERKLKGWRKEFFENTLNNYAAKLSGSKVTEKDYDTFHAWEYAFEKAKDAGIVGNCDLPTKEYSAWTGNEDIDSFVTLTALLELSYLNPRLVIHVEDDRDIFMPFPFFIYDGNVSLDVKTITKRIEYWSKGSISQDPEIENFHTSFDGVKQSLYGFPKAINDLLADIKELQENMIGLGFQTDTIKSATLNLDTSSSLGRFKIPPALMIKHASIEGCEVTEMEVLSERSVECWKFELPWGDIFESVDFIDYDEPSDNKGFRPLRLLDDDKLKSQGFNSVEEFHAFYVEQMDKQQRVDIDKISSCYGDHIGVLTNNTFNTLQYLFE